MSEFRMGSRMCNYCRRNLPSPDLCGCDGEKAARHKEMDRMIASIEGPNDATFFGRATRSGNSQ